MVCIVTGTLVYVTNLKSFEDVVLKPICSEYEYNGLVSIVSFMIGVDLSGCSLLSQGNCSLNSHIHKDCNTTSLFSLTLVE